MDAVRLRECLAADAARLRAVAAGDLTAAVPTCPGWTVADLVEHTAMVYLHKVEAMRRQRQPSPWPPPESGEPPLALFDRAYAELTAEFAARDAAGPAWTFVEHDRTVGFWVRRMAHETVVHRFDAELARGVEPAPVPHDLAVDGVDEVLSVFLDHVSHQWPEAFADVLAGDGGGDVLVRAGTAAWRVRPSPGGIDVTRVDDTDRGDDGTATVSGRPDLVLLWLWGRVADTGVTFTGPERAISHLRYLLTAATQ